jgi:DNA-binding NtrC family response regulator
MYINPTPLSKQTRNNGNQQPAAIIDNKLEALKMLASSMLTEVVALRENREIRIDAKLDLVEEVRRLEIDLIRCALIRTGGRQRQAARLLNVKPTTLHEKMKRYGILTDAKASDQEEASIREGDTSIEIESPAIS